MTKTICDRCGTEAGIVIAYRYCSTRDDITILSFDLCSECAEILKRAILQCSVGGKTNE